MKRLLSLTALIALSYCLFSPAYGQSGTKHVEVSGNIPDSLKTNGRYAYLYIQYENQAQFVDSCLIRNNRYLLQGELPFDEIMSEVVIEGVPASSGGFILNSGDRVTCNFEPRGRFDRARATGSSSSEELYRILNDSIKPLTARLFPLFQRSRETDKADPAYEKVQDSIKHYQQAIVKIWYRLLQTTGSGFNAIFAYINIAPDLSPQEKIDAETSIAQRFPDNINLSMVTGRPLKGETIADPTIESMRTFNRYATLIGELPPYPDDLSKNTGSRSAAEQEPEISISAPPQPANEEQVVVIAPPQPAEQEQEQVVVIAPPSAPAESTPEVYAVGDRVADFALPSLQDRAAGLSQIESEYILIDIWASWCAPCRKEIPIIKEVAQKYESRLHVLALSIDDNLYKWKGAIEEDGTQQFTHVILRKDNPEHEKFRKLFDIKVIPRNFLLDKNRRIVAMNLHGDDLEKKLKELMPGPSR